MKRTVVAALLSTALLASVPAIASADYAGVGAASQTVLGRSVQLVYVNLNDTNLEVKAVSAEGKVGETESLAALAQRNGALAAINGGYFNAYSDGQPLTVVRTNGKFVHNGSFGAVFGINTLNEPYFGRIYPTIEGGSDGSWSWPNTWSAWGINHYYDNPSAISILTPDAKKRALPASGKTVVVQNGVVSKIVNGDAAIPANGYLVHFGANVASSASVFDVGEKADYKITYRNSGGQPVNLDALGNMMGGGPLLVSGGAVVVDPIAEKFTDPKQTSRTSRSIRTFVGWRSDNRLVMGTVPNVSVYELADVAKALGMVHAVGMDSGATAGLYANGSYLTTPGREVPNAIIVKKRDASSVNASGYVDVYNDHYAYDAIARLKQKGVMNGEVVGSARFFKPSQTMTRAELAAVLTNAFQLPKDGKHTFRDAAGTWYDSFAGAVVNAGYMAGYSSTDFGGKDPVTEEQIVAILARVLAKSGVKETAKDRWLQDPPSSWLEKDVHLAIKQGLIVDAFGDKAFVPKEQAKRAGVASLLDVAMKKVGK
ncbi:phosphodiester glycosidase family protein [Tumebacillus lipolyticus]|uniref:Phosphodiester glycosidase family protein n=1 Tax=Tumebacillus lipolyticus TaxID=1280370 RepID=A0ABW4ZY55_9BACL